MKQYSWMNICLKSAIFLAVFSVFSFHYVPSFATNVDNGEDAICDEDTLESPTGPVRLRAEFSPETINLKWYDENGNRVSVPTASNSCTYDTSISLPPNPTKTGYKFKGWKVVPEYDFSTLTFNACGFDYAQCSVGYSKGAYLSYNTFNQTYNCMQTNGEGTRIYISCDDSHMDDLKVREWKVGDNEKTVYGNAKCSGKIGNHNDNTWNNASSNWMATNSELENASGDKRYCWCYLTGYKPSNENTIYISSNSLSWIYVQNIAVTTCNSTCAMWCAAKFASYAGLQNALLGKQTN